MMVMMAAVMMMGVHVYIPREFWMHSRFVEFLKLTKKIEVKNASVDGRFGTHSTQHSHCHLYIHIVVCVSVREYELACERASVRVDPRSRASLSLCVCVCVRAPIPTF